MTNNPTVLFVGAGNVASHLARGLADSGVSISGVYSRTGGSAKDLARAVGACRYGTYDDIADAPVADVVIFSLPDGPAEGVVSAVSPYFSAQGWQGTIFAHTSGTLPADVLAPLGGGRVGVFYPLQTFSKASAVDLSQVPFFIEGADVAAADVLMALAQRMSDNVHLTSPERRKALHIAGVLSCNFPNFLWELTQKVLEGAGYPLRVVEPLVRETVDKAFAIGPHAAQTGPARRRDTEVMDAHAEALPEDVAGVYRSLSDMIVKSHYSDKR